MIRIRWLDAARGLGIILVVIGHALGGLIDSPKGAGNDDFRAAFFAIYSFHMPLFFLLSGLLVQQRIEIGKVEFLRGLIPTLVWPCFLWSIVQFSIIFFLGNMVNHPTYNNWENIFSVPWNISQFWFLYALFCMHVLAVFLLPRIGPEGFLLLALALKALILVVPIPIIGRLVFNHIFFYAVGVWLRTAGIEKILFGRSWLCNTLLIVGAGFVGFMTYRALGVFGADVAMSTAASSDISNLAWRFPVMAAALLGVSAILAIARTDVVGRSEWLAYLGKATMPIFVLHILFTAGLRILLTRFNIISDVNLLLLLVVAAGLAGPLLVERVTRTFGLNRIFGLG